VVNEVKEQNIEIRFSHAVIVAKGYKKVKAAEIANEGITLEYESGTSRTTLEVIQSRTILLNSRIDLASSERNFLISQFNLLSAIGRLTAKQLNLEK